MTMQFNGSSGITFSDNTTQNTQAFTGFRNRIFNGSFEVAQRGTSQTQATLGYGSVDRWYFAADSGSYTVQQGTEINPFGGSYLGAYITINATSVSGGFLMQRIENVRTLASSTVTLSYYTNRLSGSDTGAQPYLRQNFGSGGSAPVNANAISDTYVNSRRTLVFNVPSTLTKTIGTNSSLDAIIPFNGTFYSSYWGVQLEPGSTATEFEYRPYGTELALCQRYFYSVGGSSLYERLAFGGVWNSATSGSAVLCCPVSLRKPSEATLGYSSLSHISGNFGGGFTSTATSLLLDMAADRQISVNVTIASGATAGQVCNILSSNTLSARLYINNEL